MKFSCMHCGQRLEADPDMEGTSVTCPACLKNITVPVTQEQPTKVAGAIPQPIHHQPASNASPQCKKCGNTVAESILLEDGGTGNTISQDFNKRGGAFVSAIFMYIVSIALFMLIPLLLIGGCVTGHIGISTKGQCDKCWIGPATKLIAVNYHRANGQEVSKQIKLCNSCTPPSTVSEGHGDLGPLGELMTIAALGVVAIFVVASPFAAWKSATEQMREFRKQAK